MTEESGPGGELTARLKAGGDAALAALFSSHRDRLWRMVQFRLDRRLAGRVDPDDVLQEAYLDAAKRLRHLSDGSAGSAYVWLRMIVEQTLIDVHRRHLGAKMRDAGRDVSLGRGGASPSTSASIVIQLVGSLTSPSQMAIRAETSRRLEDAIESMDPIDREVLALRHYEELTNSEVAEVLDIQQKAASIRYFRALKRLKAVLAQLPDFADDPPNP